MIKKLYLLQVTDSLPWPNQPMESDSTSESLPWPEPPEPIDGLEASNLDDPGLEVDFGCLSYESDGERAPRQDEPAHVRLPEPPPRKVPEVAHFAIIREASIFGHPLLADGLGYRYGIRKQGPGTWNWSCNHRNQEAGNIPCKARVSQRVRFQSGNQSKL